MTRLRAVLLVLAALFITTPATRAQAPKSGGTSDADALIAKEQSLYDELMKNDWAGFNKTLGSDFTYVSQGGAAQWDRTKSAEMLKDCKTGKWTMTDTKVTPAGTDVLVLTYKVAGEQTCAGKKSPSPVYAMSVWQKRAGNWVVIAHSETPVPPVPLSK